MDLKTNLMIRKVKLEERIESLQGHIVNLTAIGGEGRLALADQFEEKVEKLKQKMFELNIELDDL